MNKTIIRRNVRNINIIGVGLKFHGVMYWHNTIKNV